MKFGLSIHTFVKICFLILLFVSLFSGTNPEFIPALIPLFVALAIFFLLMARARIWEGVLSRQGQFVFGGLTFLFALLTVRWIITCVTVQSLGLKTCFTMPSLIPKLECAVSLEPGEGNGVRQMLFHLLAIASLLAIIGLYRVVSEKFVKLVVLFLPLTLSVIAIAGNWHAYVSFLGVNWIYSYSHRGRLGTAVVANHGWLWPLLAPGLSLALGLMFNKSAKWRSLGFVGSIIIGYAILLSGQRGGILFMVGCAFATGGYLLLQKGMKWPSRLWSPRRLGIGIVVTTTAVVLLLRLHPDFFDQVFPYLGLTRTKAIFTKDPIRLALWHISIEGISRHPLLGGGYDSWFNGVRALAKEIGKPNWQFVTGHNFWIQTMFELGLFHLLLIVSFFGLCAVFIWRRVGFHSGFIFFLIGCLTASFFQEVDHVLPVYLQFAMVFGTYVGPLIWSEDGSSAVSKSLSTKYRRRIIALSATSVVVTIFLLLQVGWGGYSYGKLPTSGGMLFNRAMRPYGTIVAFPTKKHSKAYSVFPFLKDIANISVTPLWGGQAFVVSRHHITLENGAFSFGRPYFFLTLSHEPDEQRLLGFRLEYPAIQSNMAISEASGLHQWEYIDIGHKEGAIWCGPECKFHLTVSKRCLSPTFVLTAPRPDVSASSPLKVEVVQSSVNAPSNFQFQSADERLKLALNSNEQEIQIKVDREFIPSKVPMQGDLRRLGVMIRDVECMD